MKISYIDGDLFVACISQNEINMFAAVTSESEPTALVTQFVWTVHAAAARAIENGEYEYDEDAQEYTFREGGAALQ